MTSVKQLVQSGHFHQAIKADRDHLDRDERAWLVGALSFVGDKEQVLKELGELATREDQALRRARFFALLLFVRTSDHKQAAALARALQKESESFEGAQGLGFKAYFAGHFGETTKLAQKAQSLSRDDYERFLSVDLMGHGLVQSGQTLEGLSALEQARELALQAGLEGQARATEIAILVYKAEYGIELNSTRQAMDAFIAHPVIQDFYSLTHTLIHRARSALLEGRYHYAQELSQKAALSLVRTQNKRQTIALNLLLARLAALRGDFMRAFALVETTQKLCDPKNDSAFLSKLLGMKRELIGDLKDHPWSQALGLFLSRTEQDQLNQELIELAQKTQSYQALHIEARYHKRPTLLAQTGHPLPHDPLGDILDRVHLLEHSPQDKRTERQLVAELWRQELLGLVSRLPHFRGVKSFVALSWLPDNRLLIAHEGDLTASSEPASGLVKQLFKQIANGPKTKEQLISLLYHYQYDPLIHDPLIYALIGRARRLLGEKASLLTLTEEGYALLPEVSVLDGQLQLEDAPLSERPLSSPLELNSRQILLLDQLAEEKIFISPGEYRELFQVSRITATRDLRELCQLGLLKAYGRARGVKYRLNAVAP